MRVAIIFSCILLVALLSVAFVMQWRSPVTPELEPDAAELAEARAGLERAEIGADPDSAEVATAREQLGVLLIRHGRYAEAREQFEHALAIRQDALDETGPSVPNTLDGLAEAQWKSGDLGAAKLTLERALAIRK